MNYWLTGAWALLQGMVVSVLAMLCPSHSRLRSIAAGVGVGLILFALLPEALRLGSTLILAPALVLGIILSVFLRESALPPFLNWCLWLFVYIFLQAKGVLGPHQFFYLLPLGLAEPKPRWRHALLLLITLPAWVMGALCPLAPKWSGLLMSLACGMMLEHLTHSYHKNLAGGIAIGIILSFI